MQSVYLFYSPSRLVKVFDIYPTSHPAVYDARSFFRVEHDWSCRYYPIWDALGAKCWTPHCQIGLPREKDAVTRLLGEWSLLMKKKKIVLWSRRGDRTYSQDSRSPLVLINHRSWKVFYTASGVHAELVNVSFCWSTIVLVCPWVGVHWRTSLMSLSLLLTQHVFFVSLGWLARREVSDCLAAVLSAAASRICSKQHQISFSI